MTIIEKLGIKSEYKTSMVNGDVVLKLEKQRNELLVALIEMLEDRCNTCIHFNPHHKNCTECDDVLPWRAIIEKITMGTWDKIKELLA